MTKTRIRFLLRDKY